MRFCVLAILLASLTATGTSAQQLLVFGDNALPSCAQQCSSLSQAQAACVPPASPVTNQVNYQSCFCQSGYLAALENSPETVCGDVCSTTNELTQIATWYLDSAAGAREGFTGSNRGATPVNDLGGTGYRGKGKNRVRVDHDEI